MIFTLIMALWSWLLPPVWAIAPGCTTDQCQPQKKPFLEQALLACQLQRKTYNCEEAEKRLPELSERFLKCDAKNYCKQSSQSLTEACYTGYKNSIIDLGLAVKDTALSLGEFVNQTWQDYKTDHQKKRVFLQQCDKSLSCKKDLVREDHRYNQLPDEELLKLSAVFLDQQARDLASYKQSLHRLPDPNFKAPRYDADDDEQALDYEQNEKFKDLLAIAKQKAQDFNQEFRCYHEEAQVELGCYILGNIVDPTLIAGYYFKGARAAKKGLDLIEEIPPTTKPLAEAPPRRGSQISNSEVARAKITQEYLEFNPVSVAENELWIAKADAGKKSGQFFLDIENSKMKELNDSLKDKNLVTSLTNYHKDLTLQELKKLQKKYPDLEISPYSDFKSLRFAFAGKIPKNLEQELGEAFDRVNAEFHKKLQSEGLARQNDQPKNWFRAGFAESADEANMAARYARNQENQNKLQTFGSSDLQQNLQGRQMRIEGLRSELKKDLAGSRLIDGDTFHEDVFDIVRKSDGDLNKIRSDIKNRYQVKDLSAEKVQKIKDYVESINDFSPGIRSSSREIANLDNANFGGLSADIIGLGSANLKATADGMARASDLSQAIVETRQGERAVTRSFVAQKDFFQEALKQSVDPSALKTVCSGDDCVAVATRPLLSFEKQNIVNRISASEHAGKYRLAFIPEGIRDSSVRNNLATHGEAIEKVLRQSLGSEMNSSKMKQVTFAMDMKTDRLGQGPVQLIIGVPPGRTLHPLEKLKIEKKFEEALKKINADLKKNNLAGTYHSSK